VLTLVRKVSDQEVTRFDTKTVNRKLHSGTAELTLNDFKDNNRP